MSPGDLHPVEPLARELALALLGVTDPQARCGIIKALLEPFYDDLVCRGVYALTVTVSRGLPHRPRRPLHFDLWRMGDAWQCWALESIALKIALLVKKLCQCSPSARQAQQDRVRR